MSEAYGVEMFDIPADFITLEAVCVLKCLDADGNSTVVIRQSDGLNNFEAVGMLDIAHRAIAKSLVESFDNEREDEDD